MITFALAERFHARSIEEFGGAHGLRDRGAVEAALARPYQTFGGEDLYPSPAAKAAALMESVIIRHPWVDGISVLAWVSLCCSYARKVYASKPARTNCTTLP